MMMGGGLDWVRRARVLPDAETRRLVTLAQHGDRRAADLVVRSLARAVLAEANQYRAAGEVEEYFAIGIDGALEALIKRYDAKNPAAVITYALATAKGLMQNEAARARKSDRRERPIDLRDHGVHDPAVPAAFEAMEQAQVFFVAHARARHVLRSILDGLPTKQARVARFALLRSPGMPVKQIARKEGMGVQHVSNVVRRVVQQVKAEMVRRGMLNDLA